MTKFANRSFWIDDYGEYHSNAPLQQDISVDVVVIGGGYTGLSTAWHLRQADNAMDVALIEAEIIGYGASGRNSGWVMTQFGMDQLLVRQLYGEARATEAYQYCSRAVDYVQQLIREHNMDSDYRHPGVMRVAFGEKWIPELEELKKLYDDIGVGAEMQWLDEDQLKQEFNSSHFKAGIFEPNMGHLHPVKHVREWKRLATEASVQIYENTPAIDVDREGAKIRIKTPRGTILADKLVLATNGFTHLVPGIYNKTLKRTQAPLFARSVITEPLTEEQWEAVKWTRRCSVEGTLRLFHWFNTTADGRIMFFYTNHMGFPKGDEMNMEYDAEGMDVSIRHFRALFPCLKDVKIAQHWGGPLSASCDMVPHIGTLEGGRVVYCNGYWGHGVAMSQLNGRTIADLLVGNQSDLTDFWIVDRKPLRWPPSPLDNIAKNAVLKYYRWLDRRAIKNTVFDL